MMLTFHRYFKFHIAFMNFVLLLGMTDVYLIDLVHAEAMNNFLQKITVEPTWKLNHLFGPGCLNGGISLKDKQTYAERCECLLHFEGLHCEAIVNYCLHNYNKSLCGNDEIECQPRLGGYNCNCPESHMGISCLVGKRKAIKVMKNPQFAYHPLQQVSLPSKYIFYAQKPGVIPRILIDMGDGTVFVKYWLDFRLIKDGTTMLLKDWFPLNYVPQGALHMIEFHHQYEVPGIYNISVKATNRNYLVFESVFVARVLTRKNCEFTTVIKNSARIVESTILYRRNNPITVFSTSKTNCSHAKFNHQWVLYRQDKSQLNMKDTQPYLMPKNVNINSAHLHLPPYSLSEGLYVVEKHTQMLHPQPYLNSSTKSWIRVIMLPIVVKISGGSIINAHWDESFVLNATQSYDPNIPSNEQTSLTFKWICNFERMKPLTQEWSNGYDPRKDQFCYSVNKLEKSGPILHVPAFSLQEYAEYMFRVFVSKNHLAESSSKSIKIIVDSEDVPLVKIKCLKNCGDRPNPHEITSLLGVCENCANKTYSEWTEMYDVSWNIHTDDPNEVLNTKNTEFGLNNPNLIVFEEGFSSGATYIITFIVTENSGHKKEAGYATLVISMNEPPKSGTCSLKPEKGFAVMTSFSCKCDSFADEHQPLTYELIQYYDFNNRDERGNFIGFDMAAAMENFTLGPGRPEFDYITIIRIIITDSLGLYTYQQKNITVLPLFHNLMMPSNVLFYLTNFATADNSRLALSFTGGDIQDVMQSVISTCLSLNSLLTSEEILVLNSSEVEENVRLIKISLVNYLNQVSVSSIQGLKHLSCALNHVLQGVKIQINDILSRYGSLLLRNFLKNLKENIDDSIFSEVDLEGIGHTVLDISSAILMPPMYDFQAVSSLTKFVFNEEDDYILEYIDVNHRVQAKLLKEISYETFENLRIISNMMLRYKVNNERATIIKGKHISLLLKKASPENMGQKNLKITSKASAKFFYPFSWFKENSLLEAQMIVSEVNPFWWNVFHKDINFPIVTIILHKGNERIEKKIPAEIEIYSTSQYDYAPKQIYHGELKVQPYWMISDSDIRVHKVEVKVGSKLLVKFLPFTSNFEIKVVAKKGYRPELHDFWEDALIIPQRSLNASLEERLTFFIDDAATEESFFFYIGILPHLDTIDKLLMDKIYVPGYSVNIPVSGGYSGELLDINRKLTETKTFKSNITVPYSMAVYSVRCFRWNDSILHWSSDGCVASPPTTVEKVCCSCTHTSTVSAAFANAFVEIDEFKGIQMAIPLVENPLVLYIFLIITILFIGLLIWATVVDGKDVEKRSLIYLANDVECYGQVYLVVVCTGRRMGAGTTSHVAIQLVGDKEISEPYILCDDQRRVLTRGSQDCFVIKTKYVLGDIWCINLWHDYWGKDPSWYCDRVVVMDACSRQVWFFITEQWLSPLHGDGKMSCSVYRTAEFELLSYRFIFHDNLWKEVDNGKHCWIGIIQRNPYSKFSRKQRVGFAFTHTIIILFACMLLYGLPFQRVPAARLIPDGHFYFSWIDIYLGLVATLIAFPVQLILSYMFGNIQIGHSLGRNPYKKRKYMHVSTSYSHSKFGTISKRDEIRIPDGNFKQTCCMLLAKLCHNKWYPISRTRLYKLKKYAVPLSLNLHEKGIFLNQVDVQKESLVSMHRPKTVQIGQRRTVSLRKEIEQIPEFLIGDVPLHGEHESYNGIKVPYTLKILPGVTAIIIIIFITIYIVINALTFAWVTSFRVLTAFGAAMCISIFILEPLKLFIIAIYKTSRKKKLKVEDYIKILDRIKRIPKSKIPEMYKNEMPRVEKMKTKYPDDFYKPLQKPKITLLQRNTTVEHTTRNGLLDFCIYLILVIILISLILNNLESLGYLQVKNVENLLDGHLGGQKPFIKNYRYSEDFIDYLNNTVIPMFHEEQFYNGEKLTEKYLSSDVVNYNIGVMRIRQIRLRPEDCLINLKKNETVSKRCKRSYSSLVGDQKNYAEKWSSYTSEEYKHIRTAIPWIYKRWWELENPALEGIMGLYSGGGYVAPLGRTRYNSKIMLEYLFNYEWFDHRTIGILVEFTLYNPSRKLFTCVTILCENLPTGQHAITKKISILRMCAFNSPGEIFTLTLFVMMVVLLLLLLVRESPRVNRYHLSKISCNFWHLAGFLVAVIGVLATFAYARRAISASKAMLNLSQWTMKHMIFNETPPPHLPLNLCLYWDSTLTILIGVMLFLCTVKFIQVSSLNCHFYRLTATMISIRGYALCILICLMILTIAFTSFGHIALQAQEYRYRNFPSSFFNMLRIANGRYIMLRIKQLNLEDLGSPVSDNISFAYLISVLLILSNGFLAMYFDCYARVKYVGQKPCKGVRKDIIYGIPSADDLAGHSHCLSLRKLNKEIIRMNAIICIVAFKMYQKNIYLTQKVLKSCAMAAFVIEEYEEKGRRVFFYAKHKEMVMEGVSIVKNLVVLKKLQEIK